jgi:predicted ATPase/DNA-binding SARP family transcriptional activator
MLAIHMQYRILGSLAVAKDGAEVVLGSGKQRALVALLLLHANEPVTTDRLIDQLWGESRSTSATKVLQNYVSKLRRLLGEGVLITRGHAYELRVESGELDLDRFNDQVAAGRQALAAGDPAHAAAALAAALALWHGPPLADFAYDQFALTEIERLDGLRLAALVERIEADLQLGRHAALIAELEALVAENPLQERLRGQLMLALYRSGRQAEALHVYQATRVALVDELGIEPSRELQRLERQILNHDPELAVADAVSAPRNLAAALVSLPRQPTSLVGREREIREVIDLLRRPEVRLVTLTGTGGTGKTRLAVRVAAELLDDFADGVVFIALAPLQDPGLVPTTAAQALGVLATSGDTIAEDLGRHLRDRDLLLVLDNFEHVLAAAPLLADIAAAGAGVKMLVTSRAPLRLSAERIYPVWPLETPDGSEDVECLVRRESVALFESRARAVRPDFAVTPANAGAVAEICTALDGLPLAIELAATRVGALPPAALLQRLDRRLLLLRGGARDAPERQRTLRATIDWSYELLEPEEQRLFARLAAFAGGCTIKAAESVCGHDRGDVEVVDGLASLTDKGLARLEGTDEEPRFTMLETIREYAAERLQESATVDELRRRHAEYFLALVEETEPNLVGIGSHAQWLDRLEVDHDNIRAAMDWLESSGETDRVLRFAAALWRFWDQKGHLVEGRSRLEGALRSDDRPTAARANALSGAADMALTGGDVATGRRCAESALELHRKLGDAWGTAFSLLMFAYAVGQEGDWASAQQLYAESARGFRECRDEHYALRATRSLGWAYYEGGDLEHARQLFEENLRQAIAAHDEYIQGFSLSQLADIAVDEQRFEDAVSMLTESYRILRELNDLFTVACAVGRFASVLAPAGQAATAARVLSSSTALLEEIGASPPSHATINEKTLTSIHAQLDEAEFAQAWEQGRALTADEAVALALDSLAPLAVSKR